MHAYPYMMIYLIGTVPSMIATGMNPFINAQGYATTGMLSVAIGAVANLILDPLFIFVFGLGIKGAAIATGAFPVFVRSICASFPGAKGGDEGAAFTEKGTAQLCGIREKYCKPWNGGLYYAADQQSGNDLLQ